jgi:6-phosphofructokinase 1
MIQELKWDDVQGILHKGGTIIGTARCAEFREKEGRRKAVKNLIKLGIDALVVIGGDGSLTGADCLRSEWQEHIRELLGRSEITEGDLKHGGGRNLSIVGLVGRCVSTVKLFTYHNTFFLCTALIMTCLERI